MDSIGVEPFVAWKLLIELAALAVLYLIVESRRFHTRAIFAFRLWNGGVPISSIPNSYNGNYTQGNNIGTLLFVLTVVTEIVLTISLDIGFAPGISEVYVRKTPSPVLGFPTAPISLCVVTEKGEGLVKEQCFETVEDCSADVCNQDCECSDDFCNQDCAMLYDRIYHSQPIPTTGEDDTRLSFVDGWQSVPKPPRWGEKPYDPRVNTFPHFTRHVANCTQVSPSIALRIGHVDGRSLQSDYREWNSDVSSPLSTSVTKDDNIYVMAPDGGWQRHFESSLLPAGVTSGSCGVANVSRFGFKLVPQNILEDDNFYARVSCELPLSIVQPKGICNKVSHSIVLTGVSGRALRVRDSRILGRGTSGCLSRAYEVTYDAYLANVSTCHVDEQAVSFSSILINEITAWSLLSTGTIPLSDTAAVAVALLDTSTEVSEPFPNVTGEWFPPTDEGRIWLYKPKDAVGPLSDDDMWVSASNNLPQTLTVRAGWLPEANGALITLYIKNCYNCISAVRQYSVTLPQDEAILRMVQFTLADSYLNCRQSGPALSGDDVLSELHCFSNALEFNILHNIGEEKYLEQIIVPVVTLPFAVFLIALGAMTIYSAFVLRFRGRPVFKHPGTHYDWYLMGRRDAGDLKAGGCTSFGRTPPDAYVGVAMVSTLSDHLGVTAYPLPEPSGRLVLGLPNSFTTLDQPWTCPMTNTADISSDSPPANQLRKRKMVDGQDARQMGEV